ncbi:hypothetical protein MW887_000285 [Aspergillus wentii]|nr:hypothetical protein MW887_000285 [Aspergillus wentii]
MGIVPSVFAQIVSYSPSSGSGVTYSVNIPKKTAQLGNGTIYFQLEAPANISWFAFGQGSEMTDGNLFIVYSGINGNVTLSTRSTSGHYEPSYDSSIRAFLLEGSGVRHGLMTANIRCDSCMSLHSGNNIMSNQSSWIWALKQGDPLRSSNTSYPLDQHDWHGIFSLDLTKAIGGNFENPFTIPYHSIFDYTPKSFQQQISDILLHKKRIAHGVITSIAFVLLFPNFALTIFIPSRFAVPWIHAPLQMFAVCMALAGFGIGVSVAKDLQELGGYHGILGYVAIIGVSVFQPILGIIQHLRYRKTKEKTLYGLVHRWFGRFCCILGIVNGGIGFHYAVTKNPDIPPASPIAYGLIAASVGGIYVSVVLWKTFKFKPWFCSRSRKPLAEKGSHPPVTTNSLNVDASKNKAWLP